MNKQIKEGIVIILVSALLGSCVSYTFANLLKTKYDTQDVNKDGVVDIMDMMEIKKYMIDNGIEFQSCGLE